MSGYRNRRRKENMSVFGGILLCVLVFLMLYLIYFWCFRISPNLDTIAVMKAKSIVTRTVNEAINQQFGEETEARNLLITETDADGNIEMVQSDTRAINQLLSQLSTEIQHRYNSNKTEYKTSVPLGSILGSQILSQRGPSVELTILPMAVSGMDFKTEFEAQGINQTKYKVYVVMETEARVMAPFSSSVIEVKNTILIAEAIILGKVPQSYVQVPQDGILDGMDSGEFEEAQ